MKFLFIFCIHFLSYSTFSQDFEGEVKYTFDFKSSNSHIENVMKIVGPPYISLFIRGKDAKQLSYKDSLRTQKEQTYSLWKEDILYLMNVNTKEAITFGEKSKTNRFLSLERAWETKHILGYECQKYIVRNKDFYTEHWVAEFSQVNVSDGWGLVIKGVGVTLELNSTGNEYSFSYKATEVVKKALPKRDFSIPFDFQYNKSKMPDQNVFKMMETTNIDSLNNPYQKDK